MVSSLVPKSDVVTHKRLKNLRKLQERRKKLGERQDDDDDADSDDGLGFQLKSKPKTIDEILADSDGDDMEVDQVNPLLRLQVCMSIIQWPVCVINYTCTEDNCLEVMKCKKPSQEEGYKN